MRPIRNKLSYANVMATIAVFIALGGASYAAIKVPKNSVGTRQIKNEAITAAKIRNDAVTGSKIAVAGLGTVPSAMHAANADTALNASHADNSSNAAHATIADTAGNSQTVGGRSAEQLVAAGKLTCPSGMKLEMGLCFETSTRTPTAQSAAIFTCSDQGRWLPNLEQIIAFQTNNFGANHEQPEEWSNDTYREGVTEFGLAGHITSFGAAYGPKTSSTSKAYRCVVLPTN